MAETQIPTFKLVLVGDGGTGKVSSSIIIACFIAALDGDSCHIDCGVGQVGTEPTLINPRC